MNNCCIKYNYDFKRKAGNRPAVALVLTLVVLVILSAIVYSLSSRLAEVKHRQQYIFDYQTSRYAADSAMKYAMSTIGQVKLKLANRKEKPDFSDLFTLDREEYEQLLYDWAEQLYQQKLMEEDSLEFDNGLADIFGGQEDDTLDPLANLSDAPEITDPNLLGEDDRGRYSGMYGIPEPNDLTIPGPYGPQWPYVQEPIEFQIGKAKVTIIIEDENAKMPLTWAITTDKNVNRRAQTALETFCQWMQMTDQQINDLKVQLKDVGEKKQFQLQLKDVVATKNTPIKRTPRTRTSRRSRSKSKKTAQKTTTTKVRSAIGHTTDFAKLLHSSMVDLETLATALPDTGNRDESPLKYLAMWGSQKVNINTAPRHVLEAAFTFGGDAEEIADEIIQLRKEEPFKKVDELKSRLYGYTDSIEKTMPYITTTSTFLTVRITAVCGRAETSSVATVIKNGNKAERIAIISQ